ncbi:helix-turn-helix domain-containing protein [Niallia endozanthoxylica]|uniref:helix-turn-helix domain-containing protein n=1 Tax=Niallia endozanthoxylica TaxID=2036016 RepID=UPI00168B785B|nr:helix-turn-helix transcriptional regulator [Niallia endozanthoxylica]
MPSKLNHTMMQQGLDQLADITSSEERIIQLLQIYVELFPVKNALLFRYSPLGHLAEGIVSIDSTGINYIFSIRDDVRSLPGIFSAIHEYQAKYIPSQDYLTQLGSKYIPNSDSLYSVLVVPICTGSTVIGYICSNEFDEEVMFHQDLLSDFTRFGNLSGKLFKLTSKIDSTHGLSKRELEVMEELAKGGVIKQLVDILGISETTIKQYVKSVIKKLGVQNRTQAVAELVRRGVIS